MKPLTAARLAAKAYIDWTHQVDNAKVYVEHKKDWTAIAFRGSDGFADLFRAADAAPQWVPEIRCHVHRGMWIGASAIFKLLCEAGRCHPVRPIVLTGHSKGAAQALLFALKLRANGHPVDELHLFGCPMVAGPEASALLHGVRVRNYRTKLDHAVHMPVLTCGLPNLLRGHRVARRLLGHGPVFAHPAPLVRCGGGLHGIHWYVRGLASWA